MQKRILLAIAVIFIIITINLSNTEFQITHAQPPDVFFTFSHNLAETGYFTDWSFDSSLIAIIPRIPDRILILDASTGEELSSIGYGLPCPDADLCRSDHNRIAWSPTQIQLAVHSEVKGEFNFLSIWDVGSETIIHDMNLGVGTSGATAWSPDGDKIAASSQERGIVVFDIQTGEELYSTNATDHPQHIYGLDWSSDGTMIVSSDIDANLIQVWDATDLSLLSQVESVMASNVQWSPNSQSFAYVSFGAESFGLVSVKSDDEVLPEPIVSVISGLQPFSQLSFSPSDPLLALGDTNTGISIFDLSENVFTQRFPDITGIGTDFSPDGSKLVSGNDILQRSTELDTSIEHVLSQISLDSEVDTVQISNFDVVTRTDELPQWGRQQIPIDGIYIDFLFQASVEFLGSSQYDRCGIVMRQDAADPSDAYNSLTLLLSPEGDLFFWEKRDGNDVDVNSFQQGSHLVEGTVPYFSFPAKTNMLTVIGRGNIFSIFINGDFVSTYENENVPLEGSFSYVSVHFDAESAHRCQFLSTSIWSLE